MRKKQLFPMILLVLAALLGTAAAALGEGSEAESLLVISDAHLTQETQAHAAAIEAVIQAAKGKDAVLFLGDNTNNTHTEEQDCVLEWAREINRQTGAEVYIIPGNHDYSARMGPGEYSALFAAYGWNAAFSRDTSTASYAVRTRKGTCLLMLDTNKFDEASFVEPDGGIGSGTLKWVQEVLDALPDGTLVLACGHHPILPRERNGRTPGAYALSQMLSAYGVGLYLCGHDHGFATAEQDGLRQITVGQPQAYPGWAGIVERERNGFRWRTEQLYDAQSPVYLALRENAYALGRSMARGTLTATPYADDEAASEWFASAFMLFAGGEMTPEKAAILLADENCGKWREANTRTVVKEWMLNLLENCPEDVRQIPVPSSRKHPLELGT